MAEKDVETEEGEGEKTLVFGLTTQQPISAAEIGRLLIDLQADYQRLYGRTLVLAKFETGSFWAHVQDAATWLANHSENISQWADTGSHVLDFGKKILDAIKRKDIDAATLPLSTRAEQDEELRFVERMVKTATKANSGFEMYSERDDKAGTKKMMVRLTPADTRRIHNSSKRMKAVKQATQALPNPHGLISPPSITTSTALSVPNPWLQDDLTSRLEERLKALPSSAPEDDVRALVAALVSVLSPYGLSPLEDLAKSLEASGRHHVASIVRRHIPPT
jgi:hypothetical protein